MRLFLVLGGVNAFLAVAAGAFGAHALKARLSERHLAIFETGARYHMYHALGLFAVAWLAAQQAPGAQFAGWSMTAGIALFSGSLYALALTGIDRLGMITPLGGLAFLLGWAALVYSALRLPPR
jgi:uncharacterized membrane protein YgdD (TMEM256/DUF423 family)